MSAGKIKASELIERLAQEIARNGDLEVAFASIAKDDDTSVVNNFDLYHVGIWPDASRKVIGIHLKEQF